VTDEEEEIRYHMLQNPDHEVIVGEDDEWHCLTCEDEEFESE
jgi:hypothetical protein